MFACVPNPNRGRVVFVCGFAPVYFPVLLCPQKILCSRICLQKGKKVYEWVFPVLSSPPKMCIAVPNFTLMLAFSCQKMLFCLIQYFSMYSTVHVKIDKHSMRWVGLSSSPSSSYCCSKTFFDATAGTIINLRI